MLLVQDICLSWGKDERGSFYAKLRTDFPVAYLLDKLPGTLQGDVFVHRLNFWQKGTGFQVLCADDAYRFQIYSSAQDLNLANLSVRLDMERYEVTFFNDERRSGRPGRRGHNKDYHNIAYRKHAFASDKRRMVLCRKSDYEKPILLLIIWILRCIIMML